MGHHEILNSESDISERLADDINFTGDGSIDSFVSKFLIYVARYKPIPFEEQLRLSNKVQHNNDLQAREALIAPHIKFAWKIAMKYRHYGIPEETLKAEAVEKLFELAKKFDPAKNYKFITYMNLPVKGHVQKCVLKHHGIPNINKYQSMFFNLNALKFNLETKNPGITSAQMDKLLLEHYASHTKDKVDIHDIRFIEDRLASIHKSLNDKVSNGEEAGEILDAQPSLFLGPLEVLEAAEESFFQQTLFDNAFCHMTQQERKVAEFLYFEEDEEGKPQSMRAAAKNFGIRYPEIVEIDNRIIAIFRRAAQEVRANFDSVKSDQSSEFPRHEPIKTGKSRTVSDHAYVVQVLEMAQTYIHLTETIPEEYSPGPNREPNFWSVVHKELKRRFPCTGTPVTVDNIIKAWLKDNADVFAKARSRNPGPDDGLIAGHDFLTWRKVDLALERQKIAKEQKSISVPTIIRLNF